MNQRPAGGCVPPFAERLFFSPGTERSDARPRGKAARVYVLRQAVSPEEQQPSSRAIPPFARPRGFLIEPVQALLVIASLVILVACASRCAPAAARPPVPDVVHQVEVLEAQVIAAQTSSDGCERALRRAKQRGGVVYVDSNGHCTFVRELPSRKR